MDSHGLVNHTPWEACKRCRQIIPFHSAHASWPLTARHCEGTEAVSYKEVMSCKKCVTEMVMNL